MFLIFLKEKQQQQQKVGRESREQGEFLEEWKAKENTLK